MQTTLSESKAKSIPIPFLQILYRRKKTPWPIFFKDEYCVPTQTKCSYLNSNANTGARLQGLSETYIQDSHSPDLYPETLGPGQRIEESISVSATQRSSEQLAFSISRKWP